MLAGVFSAVMVYAVSTKVSVLLWCGIPLLSEFISVLSLFLFSTFFQISLACPSLSVLLWY